MYTTASVVVCVAVLVGVYIGMRMALSVTERERRKSGRSPREELDLMLKVLDALERRPHGKSKKKH